MWVFFYTKKRDDLGSAYTIFNQTVWIISFTWLPKIDGQPDVQKLHTRYLTLRIMIPAKINNPTQIQAQAGWSKKKVATMAGMAQILKIVNTFGIFRLFFACFKTGATFCANAWTFLTCFLWDIFLLLFLIFLYYRLIMEKSIDFFCNFFIKARNLL